MATLRDDAMQIFRAAVARVEPERMIRHVLSLEGDSLSVQTEDRKLELDLSRFDRIFVIGAGKATAPMAKAVESVLGNRITRGTIAVKGEQPETLSRIEMIAAGHPVPDEQSLQAAGTAIELARQADERTLVINLISGGGSALLTLPYSDGTFTLTLDQMKQTTESLLRCGATIQEINCIRKHLSGIKGGRLAQAIYPATGLSLILSDVVGDDLSSIASGLTTPDNMTYSDALGIVKKYDVSTELPRQVMDVLQAGAAGEIPDTPGPDAAEFERIHNVLVGTNAHALRAASESARALGYETTVLTSQLTGEAREVAMLFVGVARDLIRFTPPEPVVSARPACIIAGGETTVTIRGGGKGGRNQEMALSFLAALVPGTEEFSNALFLSCGTDGNDGPTDAAGGRVDGEALAAARAAGGVSAALADNDAYHYLEKIGALVKTGATSTNVCDVQILLVR